MQFESNRAWQDAVTAVSANRDVLLPVAGVFFLIPAVAQSFFLSDVQTKIVSDFGNPKVFENLSSEQMTGLFGFGFVAFVAQLVGYLALLALLTDRTRPTVGEALGIALRALPTLIGAALLFVAAYLGATALLAAVVGAIAAVTGSAAVGAVLVIMFVAGLFYTMVKLSLTLPVVVIEGMYRPVTAMKRSWALTKGNSVRLALFYVLLFIAYAMLAIVTGMILMGLLSAISGLETLNLLLAGVISGVISAVAGVVFAGILASIHRQLSGDTPEAIGKTFE